MSGTVALKQEHLDMDSLFDFTQSTQSPITASSTMDVGTSPSDKYEERQQFNGPSHDYNQYKQQVGLPVGSMVNMPASQPAFDAYNSGITDFDASFGAWSSGIDIDSDMTMDFSNPQSAMPAMFFPPPRMDSPNDTFINPTSIGVIEEPTSNVGRLWPGMHSQQAQQAAMQKAAQANAHQQRQVKRQVPHAQYRQPSQTPQATAPAPASAPAAASKRASHISEPHVEESISRLLHQMRQQSTVSADDADSPSGLLPHIARMKKDEEEMDEDERLLASEEGKKLSSKERRQLRNKVSARAFRSRRKEYITQLEGEVAMKAQECNNLRQQNMGLIQENDRYRALIETLLRHPAFHPFINDLSKDPAALLPGQQQPQVQMQTPPQPQQQQQQQQQSHPQPQSSPASQPQQPASQQAPQQDIKPEFLNFDASQLQIPQSQPDQQQVGLAMIPEENFSKLNINGFNQPYAFNNFSSVNAYAVTDVPPGPDPLDLLAARPLSCLGSMNSNCGMDVLLAKLDVVARRSSNGLDA